MEEIEALIVGEERIGAMFEQKVDDVVMATFRGPQDRRCYRIPSLCVYICAILNQKVT